ncbi:MAG: 3-methyl-2-oxobutanoate hydroxymethyltransferase [Thermoguttaceae bacterium]
MQKKTSLQILGMKNSGHKVTILTAYDFPSARLIDAAGIDIILVGDSLANVVQGKATTLPVTLDEMIYHAEIVARAANQALVVVDLPFPFCQLGPDDVLRAAARIMKETNADSVKIEANAKRAKTIEVLVDAGIPVIGHCGLLPQSIRQIGGYSKQRQRDELLADAESIVNAGAFCILLECVDESIAEEITNAVPVPTIGIGSGNKCDGQVLVLHDILGFTPLEQTRTPSHAKKYVDMKSIIVDAVKNYIDDVQHDRFP